MKMENITKSIGILLIIVFIIMALSFIFNPKQNECEKRCEELEMNYFKHEYNTGGLFGSSVDNCYCLDNKEVKQIW